MSRATIEAFYAAFARLDEAAMQAAYAPDARFEDPAFSLAGRERIGAMWSMLCTGVRERGRDVWRLEWRDATDTSAHWEAHYRFGGRRLVHNVIEARFRFDAAGRIVEHVDDFDFWRWSRQALGPAGWALGWSPMLRRTVRAKAGAGLEAFIAARGRT
jgi:hypothetical protein